MWEHLQNMTLDIITCEYIVLHRILGKLDTASILYDQMIVQYPNDNNDIRLIKCKFIVTFYTELIRGNELKCLLVVHQIHNYMRRQL